MRRSGGSGRREEEEEEEGIESTREKEGFKRGSEETERMKKAEGAAKKRARTQGKIGVRWPADSLAIDGFVQSFRSLLDFSR